MKKTNTSILFESKTKGIRKIVDKDGNLKESIKNILNNFKTEDLKYFAGMIDGDGRVDRKNVRKGKYFSLRVSLELTETAAQPVIDLSRLVDSTLSRKVHYVKRNTRPSLMTEFAGAKAELFLINIYPYLLEKKYLVRNLLLQRGCPEDLLPIEKQFSYEYLAGYTDAEGNVVMKLRHQKGWKGKGITSSYKFRYLLSSNDFDHLSYIKSKLQKLGFEFRKDYINFYNSEKRKNRKPNKNIALKGGPVEHATLYEALLPHMRIPHKIDLMEKTKTYAYFTTNVMTKAKEKVKAIHDNKKI